MDRDWERMHREMARQELLGQMLRLVAALDGADAFPQDREGIEALIGRLAQGRPSEPRPMVFEDPGDLPRYDGIMTTWISPAGEGRLRARGSSGGLNSECAVVGADGRVVGFESIAGFGVPEAELTERARSERDAYERERREAEESEPERRREVEADQLRFRTANLIRAIAAPAGLSPAGPMVSYVVLYETGLSVDYLAPRPAASALETDDPWAEAHFAAMFPGLEIDDGLGTEYKVVDLDSVDSSTSPMRARLSYEPAVPAAARSLRITLGSATVAIELEAA
jgi:hypothetical protein